MSLYVSAWGFEASVLSSQPLAPLPPWSEGSEIGNEVAGPSRALALNLPPCEAGASKDLIGLMLNSPAPLSLMAPQALPISGGRTCGFSDGVSLFLQTLTCCF